MSLGKEITKQDALTGRYVKAQMVGQRGK
jgi:hypothetical protein